MGTLAGEISAVLTRRGFLETGKGRADLRQFFKVDGNLLYFTILYDDSTFANSTLLTSNIEKNALMLNARSKLIAHIVIGQSKGAFTSKLASAGANGGFRVGDLSQLFYFCNYLTGEVTVPTGQPDLNGFLSIIKEGFADIDEQADVLESAGVRGAKRAALPIQEEPEPENAKIIVFPRGVEKIEKVEKVKPRVTAPFGVFTSFMMYLCAAVYAVMALTMKFSGFGEFDADTLIAAGGLYPPIMSNFREYYRFITAAFLHAGLGHVFYNCLSLYIFGTRFEKSAGIKLTALVYFVSAVFGCVMAFFISPKDVTIGASGAVFGLIGASLVYTKLKKKDMQGLNFYILLLFTVSGILLGFVQENISNVAHISGLFAGAVVTFIWLRFKRKKRKKEKVNESKL